MSAFCAKAFCIGFVLLGLLFAQPDTTAPHVRFALPGDGGYLSCPDGDIVMVITDQSPLDLVSLWLTAAMPGTIFTVPGSTASAIDSVYYYHFSSLADGDSVWLSYAPICDMLHNCRYYVFHFWVDLSPPVLELVSPPEGVLPSCGLLFVARVFDSLSGVSADSSVVSVRVRGFDDWSFSAAFSSPSVSFADETLSVDVGLLGAIAGGDTIDVCVDARDAAQGCGANEASECFRFLLPYTPPGITFIYPPDGVISACPDSVVFLVSDVDSVVDVCLVVGEDTICLGDPRFSRSGDTFFVNTAGLFVDAAYQPLCVYCADVYRTSAAGTLWVWADLSPPYVVDVEPPWGALLVDTVETISVWLDDAISGVDWSSITLTVDGVATPFGRDSVAGRIWFEYVFHGVGEALDSADVTICIQARDKPDMCFNPLDTCFTVRHYVDTRKPDVTPPEGIVTACEDQWVVVSVFSVSGLDSPTVTLQINDDLFDLASPQLYMTSFPSSPSGVVDSLFFVPSPGYWRDGDTILCQFNANTIFGPHLNRLWLFYTDFSPPYFEALFPVDGELCMHRVDSVVFRLGDAVAGLWEPSFVCSLGVGGDFVNVPLAALVERGDTFTLRLADVGVQLRGCDSVLVCLGISDRVAEQYCGPNRLDTCWSFSLDCSAPSAELILPEEGSFVSCEAQPVAFAISEDVNLDSSTIAVVLSEGDTFLWGSASLVFTAPGTLVFLPPAPWTSGEVVSGELLPVCDSVGNCSSVVPFYFTVDLEPPRIEPVLPPPGAVVSDSMAVVKVLVRDELSGVSDVGVAADFGGAFTGEVADTFIFDPALAGAPLGPEDSVFVMVWASDSATLCGANSDTVAYWFVVDAVGPRLVGVDAPPYGFTSCPDRRISFRYEDFLGIDTFFVAVFSSHSGETLFSSDPQVHADDTLVVFVPASPYADGETVSVCVVSAPDLAGNPSVAESVCASFVVDLTPPVVTPVFPAAGDTVGTVAPLVEFSVVDSVSGVWWGACSVFVGGACDTVLLVGDAGVSIFGETLTVDFGAAGIFLVGGDSVEVCLVALDSVLDEAFGCPPHRGEDCVWFFIDASPPSVAPARPAAGAISSCVDQAIAFVVTDSEGVCWDTLVFVVEGDTLGIHSPGVEHPTGTDSVIYTPPAPYGDDTVSVCVVYVVDTLGNSLDAPVCWEFYIDTIPPSLVATYPPPGGVVGAGLTAASAVLEDIITGIVVVDSFCIDGAWSSSPLYWDGESLAIDVGGGLLGGVHSVCVAAYDLPDLCPPNGDILCWSFVVDDMPPAVSAEPESIVVACDSVQFAFLALDVDSVVVLDVSSDGDLVYSVAAPDDTTALVEGFVLAPPADGAVSVWITVSDTVGNVSGDTVVVFFDRTPPAVGFLSPLDGETLSTTQPLVVFSASDFSGVSPGSAFVAVGGDTAWYHRGEVAWDGAQFTCDLGDVGVSLPERGWSAIVAGGVADSVPDTLCGPNVAPPESVVVFVADDDTTPPAISGPTYDYAWCGGEFAPTWAIFDPSGVDSAWMVVCYSAALGECDTIRLLGGDSLWSPLVPVVLTQDTVWVRACASDADSDPGFGDDGAFGCTDFVPVVCTKPFVAVFPETLLYGAVCVDSVGVDSFAVTNPTGVYVDVEVWCPCGSVFVPCEQVFSLAPLDTEWVAVDFRPAAEVAYGCSLLVLAGESVWVVVALGEGRLCPLGFSAQPLVISPNGDGAYDRVEFTFPLGGDNRVDIFRKCEYLVRRIRSSGVRAHWDGLDERGRACPPGPYCFVAYSGGKLVGKGIIILVR